MTFEQFIEKLKRHASQEGGQFTLSLTDAYGHTKLRCKVGEFEYCPLTYVALRETKRFFLSSQYVEAAGVLGIDGQLAHMIVSAADDYIAPTKTNQKVQDMRHQMLKAVYG